MTENSDAKAKKPPCHIERDLERERVAVPLRAHYLSQQNMRCAAKSRHPPVYFSGCWNCTF